MLGEKPVHTIKWIKDAISVTIYGGTMYSTNNTLYWNLRLPLTVVVSEEILYLVSVYFKTLKQLWDSCNTVIFTRRVDGVTITKRTRCPKMLGKYSISKCNFDHLDPIAETINMCSASVLDEMT